MTYTQQGDRVTVEMSRDEFNNLLFIAGGATGTAMRLGDKQEAYRWVQFMNELNRTNPNFKPYEIPEEYKAHA